MLLWIHSCTTRSQSSTLHPKHILRLLSRSFHCKPGERPRHFASEHADDDGQCCNKLPAAASDVVADNQVFEGALQAEDNSLTHAAHSSGSCCKPASRFSSVGNCKCLLRGGLSAISMSSSQLSHAVIARPAKYSDQHSVRALPVRMTSPCAGELAQQIHSHLLKSDLGVRGACRLKGAWRVPCCAAQGQLTLPAPSGCA